LYPLSSSSQPNKSGRGDHTFFLVDVVGVFTEQNGVFSIPQPIDFVWECHGRYD
jgi:hypothetical protein